MTAKDMLFRVTKKTFTRFFSLQKGKNSTNSIKSPFQWHSEKDGVITIHLMGILHFLSSYSWRRFFVRFDGQQTGRCVPFTSYSLI